MSLSEAPPLAISGFITIALGLVVLIFAYRQAKSKNYKSHKQMMILAVTLNAAFLVQYLYRALVQREETHFDGPTTIRNFVYYPILAVHITGALIVIFLVLKHILEAYRNEKSQDSGIPYFESEYRERHRSFGRLVFRLWALTYAGGITIFLMLYILF